jgi:hypothetical protein
METSGLVVTHFGGIHTYNDAIDALQEILEMHRGRRDIYEIIIHSDDIEIQLTSERISMLREEVKKTFLNFEKGALAFVCNTDLMFGLCRQLEMTMDNEKIAISVFRSEGLARSWVDEIKTIHEKK